MFFRHRIMPVLLLLIVAWIAMACAPAITSDTDTPDTAPAVDDTVAEESTPAAEEEADKELVERENVDNASDATTLTIDPARSTVRFELDEDLRGNRITVVGTTDQVSGELQVDPADLSTATVGPITIDAASFVTDADRRNQAINRFVLQSSEFETISFTPTSINGLPENAAAGDVVDFQIEGNLAIRDTVLPVVFDVAVEAVSETEIEGSAASVIMLPDFGVNIPSVPMVANVEDELELYIDFVAAAQ